MTERQYLILTLLRRHHTYRLQGTFDNVLREHGFSPTRFWQQANALIDLPAALTSDPQTVNRYRRLRDEAAERRTRERAA